MTTINTYISGKKSSTSANVPIHLSVCQKVHLIFSLTNNIDIVRWNKVLLGGVY
jgi:hypothetical protein